MRILALAAACLIVAAASSASAYEPKSAERPLYVPIGPGQVSAYERGLTLVEQKDYRGAIAAFDEVLKLQPQFAVAMSHRAFAHLEIGEYENAIAGHDAVLRLAPNRPNSWANSCWARAIATTDLDQALELCNRAIEIGGSENAYDSRGFVHFKRGEYRAAIDDYTWVIRKDRKMAGAWFMRGVAKLRLGEESAGRKDIAWAVERDPDIQETYARWGVQP